MNGNIVTPAVVAEARVMAADSQQITERVQGNVGNLTNAGKGRKKGVPNKLTMEVKQVIAAAAEKLGGLDGLVEWANKDEKNLSAFWTSIYPKLIPLQVYGDPNNPIRHIHKIELLPVEPVASETIFVELVEQ